MHKISLIDSSAESIGGLGINSVIDAAEGVADFPPDYELKSEKQLTDISASAPCMVQENSDMESGEDGEPTPKRMRLENYESELYDKLSDTKRVLFKVVPVKNGHGIWDSIQFNQVLLSKGTILLRIHASGDELENGALEKCNIEVDFTCIMVSAKEENELILGLPTQDPDVDMCDPLAIGASTTEENSPALFPQPFLPTNRRLFTALKPANQRPGYWQLQSPIHVFSNNEVLELPQSLEFEEPQSGAHEWSDSATCDMSSSKTQYTIASSQLKTENTPGQNNEQGNMGTEKTSSMNRKVGEHCGRKFNKASTYLQHLILHKPVQHCKWCNFKTEDARGFFHHIKTHIELQCNICLRYFATSKAKKTHKKKTHHLFECKSCLEDLNSEQEYTEHLTKEHEGKKNNLTIKKMIRLYEERAERENKLVLMEQSKEANMKMEVEAGEGQLSTMDENIPVQLADSENLQNSFTCHLCNKETNNKSELRTHIARHLGVSSDNIKDEDLFIGKKPFQWKEDSDMTFRGRISKTNNLVLDNPTQSMFNDFMSGKNSSSFTNLASHFAMNIPSKSTFSLLTQDSIFESEPFTISEEFSVKDEPIETDSSKTEACDDDSNLSSKRKRTYRFYRGIPCEECAAEFKTHNKLSEHIKQKHREKPTCPMCKITRKSVKKLFHHLKVSHKNKFRCHYRCLALFDTEEERSAHHLEVHNKDDSKLTCRHCKVSYPRLKKREHLLVCENKHVRKESPPLDAHECGFCESVFYTMKEYSSHIKLCGPWNKKSNVQGTDVIAVTDGSRVLGEHLPTFDLLNESTKIYSEKNSMELEQLSTDVKSNQMKSGKILNNGLAEFTGLLESRKLQHQCKHCPQTFEDQEDGVKHILEHHKKELTSVTKEPMMCHLCGKSFLASLAFCKHILNHYSELDMWDALIPPDINMETIGNVCWICNTGYLTNQRHHKYHAARRDETIENLLETKSSEPDGEPFHCSICVESFPDRVTFWKHIKFHLSKSYF